MSIIIRHEKEGLRRRGMFKYGEYLDTWTMALLVD